MGALDYTMTETRNASYMNDFTPEQLAYFYSFPKWVIATWAISVWGAVVGSIALLVRQRVALPIYAVSLATMVITFVHNFVLANGRCHGGRRCTGLYGDNRRRRRGTCSLFPLAWSQGRSAIVLKRCKDTLFTFGANSWQPN